MLQSTTVDKFTFIVSRLLLLVVSMGYGTVMWHRHLGIFALKVILLGVVYYMALEHLGDIVNDFAGKPELFMVLPLTLVDPCFIVWNFSLLSKMLEKLQICLAKLELHGKITIKYSLAAVSVLLPLTYWIGYESYFNASVISAFWTWLIFMLILVVICMLLTPSDNYSRSPSSSSSLSVDSSDDLMLEILLRLPPKPLTRLKLVSKRWESLITTNHASFLQNRGPLGLICPGERVPSFEFVPLDVQNPAQLPFSELRFPWGLLGGLHWITKSCNGLLLCCNARSYYLDPTLRPGNFGYSSIWFPELSCCVYNPTTKCVARIPRPGGYPRLLIGLNLVYDPSKSPDYKVIIMESVGGLVQIEIYSSESRSWRLFGDRFRTFGFSSHGVYWNGSIHWLTRSGKKLLYFNVEKEEFGKKVSLPPALLHHKFMLQVFDYFGESRGHLHVIGIRGKSITVEFDVHELKKDYSGWFVRYRVDLTSFRELKDYRIFSLVRGEEGKRQSFLMLIEATGALYYFKTTGKFARWNLDSNSLEEIFVNDNIVSENRMISYAFQHTESLATV